MTRNLVIDSGIGVAQVLYHPYSPQVHRLWRTWGADSDIAIHAPHLWVAETSTALRKSVFAGLLSAEEGQQLLRILLQLPVRLADDRALAQDALTWAGRLGQKRVYDALYLALAARLEGELWTTDRRLFRRARQLGLDWVHHPAAS